MCKKLVLKKHLSPKETGAFLTAPRLMRADDNLPVGTLYPLRSDHRGKYSLHNS